MNRLIFFLSLFLLALSNAVAAKEKWDPIDPTDLAATECKAYPGSSAEIMFEKQVLDYSGSDQMLRTYRRIKIYSPKGANDAGVFYIEYPTEQAVWEIAARVTKPDGSSREFTKKEFTESLFAKVGSLKVKRLTLAVPDLGPGDVLDMRWSATVDSEVSSYRWWYFQDKIPVRHFTFSLENTKVDCRLLYFNMPKSDQPPAKGKGVSLDIRDIPPFVEEPNLPPERDVRGWFLLHYTDQSMRWYKKGDIWKELSSYLEEEFRLLIRPGNAIKSKMAELTKGASTDEEKLKRLYEFCQHHVSNLTYFTSAELQAAKKKLDNKDAAQTPAQTLTLQTGYASQVNELFASLAKAAGYEVRLARSASRNATLSVQHPNGWLFIPDELVAVRLGEAWRFYAPGDYYIPAGLVDKSNESATSLICDADKVIFETVPIAKADKSPVQRKGRFQLDAEGNLEGEIEIAMSGHVGATKKRNWAGTQSIEIDNEYRESITRRIPNAEVTELQWENLKGSKLPLIARYKLRVPAYADVAGTKIILTPNVFEHGAAATFISENRQHPIYFPSAWSEHDDIEIALPEGYTLDAGSAPANTGDVKGVIGARYQVGFKGKSRKIVYQRDFALGGNGAIAFEAVSYPVLKKLFDTIIRSDEHTMVLKQIEAVAPSSEASPATSPTQPAANP